jgi:hypothetical protein
MIVSGVATPKEASNSITTVMAMPAMIPASKPAKNAFVPLMRGRSYNLVGAKELNCAD